jgi:DNA-binding NarL/FixJ family response regulator
LRILVADDHAPVRRVVCSVLRTEGWQVCGEAANGREAVELAMQLKPDVIVLDLSMPELNGLDATRCILQEMPEANIAILTLYDGQDVLDAALACGARACMVKTDLPHLVTKLRSLFQPTLSLIRPPSTPQQEPDPPDNLEPFERLNDLEREILQLLAQCKTNREIALALSVSVQTVQTCRSEIMAKLETDSIVDCVRYARKRA